MEWHRQRGRTWVGSGVWLCQVPIRPLSHTVIFFPRWHNAWTRSGGLSGPSSLDGLEFQAKVPGLGNASALERGSAKPRQIPRRSGESLLLSPSQRGWEHVPYLPQFHLS